MDEKEFVFTNNKSDNKNYPIILQEETDFLKDNLNKIESLIDYYDKEMKSAKNERDFYFGDLSANSDFKFYDSLYIKYFEKKNDILPKLNNPYFMHLNLLEGEKATDLFIGLDEIHDQNGNFIVYSIWSDVAGAFYDGDQTCFEKDDYKYDLVYKRKITIKKRKIVDLVEEYNNVDGLSDNVTDYFLRNVLESKKNEKGFSDIVKTIQKLQNTIIRSFYKDNILVQGIAGSGKTAIIVHRLSYLLYNHREISPERYLFVAPSDNFKKELNDLNKVLKIDKINLNTLNEYYRNKINYYLNLINNSDKSNNKNHIKYMVKEVIQENDINNFDLYNEDNLNKISNLVTDSILFDLDDIIDYYKINNDYNEVLTLNKVINERIKQYRSLSSAQVRRLNDIISELRRFEFRNVDFNQDYIDFFKNKVDSIFSHIIKIYSKILSLPSIVRPDIQSVLTKSKDKLNNIDHNKELNSYQKEFEKIKLKNYIKVYEKAEYLSKRVYSNQKFKYEVNSTLFLLKNIFELKTKYFDKCISAFNKIKDMGEINGSYIATFENLFYKVMLCYYLGSDGSDIKHLRNIENYLKEIIEADSKINLEGFLTEKDNLKRVSDITSTKSIIKRTFDFGLNNKYKLNNSMIIERIDAVILLYTFNKFNLIKDIKYNYLFIDEAQDYNDSELYLLYCLENKPILNIFGDYQQNISTHSKKRESWDNLIDKFDLTFKYYELNENYRNTSNVVDYCNDKLHTSMSKIGLSGKDVIEIDSITINDLLSLYRKKNYQIITIDKSLIDNIKSLDSEININNVFDVKGLEYENTIVIDKNMDYNNKYVSYTRSKNDLIVIHDVIY